MLKTKKGAMSSGIPIGRTFLLHDYLKKKFRLVKLAHRPAIAEVLVESNCLSEIKVHCAANGIKCPKPIIDFSRIVVMYPE